MGLKNVRDLPFTPSVQPVQIIGDSSDLTPAFQAPEVMFAGATAVVALQNGRVELRSLDPGGCFVGVFFASGFVAGRVYTILGSAVVTAPLVPVMTLSNEPLLSEARIDTVLPTGLPGLSVLGNPDAGRPLGPWFIPRGFSLIIEASLVNIAFEFGLQVRGVPATEHGPS